MAEYKFTWLDYAFWTLMIFTIILLAWRIFGHSPTIESLIVAVIGSEAMLWRYMYKHGREIERANSKLEKLDSIEKSLEEIKAKIR